jgi:hypothetical protein
MTKMISRIKTRFIFCYLNKTELDTSHATQINLVAITEIFINHLNQSGNYMYQLMYH